MKLACVIFTKYVKNNIQKMSDSSLMVKNLGSTKRTLKANNNAWFGKDMERAPLVPRPGSVV